MSRHEGRVARDDGAFAYHASQLIQLLPWFEKIQRATRQDLARGRKATLRPWEAVTPNIRNAYEYLRGPGQLQSGRPLPFHPILELLGAETIMRETIAGVGGLSPHLAALLDGQVEEWAREQFFSDPPIPLWRTALEAFFAVRAKGTVDYAGLNLELEPLQKVLTETFGKEMPTGICAAASGVLLFAPYMVVRANKGGRPKGLVWRTFHRHVTELFEREMPNPPEPDDFADLWRAFDKSKGHKETRRDWVDRLELLTPGDKASNI